MIRLIIRRKFRLRCRRGGYGARLVILLMWHEEAHLDPLTVILQMIHLELIGLRSAMQSKAGSILTQQDNELKKRVSAVVDLFIVATFY